jgi:hypothetical protein
MEFSLSKCYSGWRDEGRDRRDLRCGGAVARPCGGKGVRQTPGAWCRMNGWTVVPGVLFIRANVADITRVVDRRGMRAHRRGCDSKWCPIEEVDADPRNSFPFRGKGTLEAEQKAGMGVGATLKTHPHPNLPPEGEGTFRGAVAPARHQFELHPLIAVAVVTGIS